MISDRNFPLKTLEMGFQRIDTSKLYLGAFPRNSLEALAFGDCLFRRWTKAIPISHPQKVGQSGSRNSAFVFFFWVIELYSKCFCFQWMVSFLCRLFYPENNFKSDLERERQFGATFTHTLYYLAQVNAAMGQSEKGAKYCHTTLLRQLETGQYDPVDWALNCATLSQYYITQGNYMLSRHCLGKCRLILVVFNC